MSTLIDKSIRNLTAEEMELIAGGTGPGTGGVWDSGSGDGGCVPIPDLGAE